MTDTPFISEESLAADPEDRLFARVDPIWRAARRRFAPVLVGCLLLHATVIAVLFLGDEPDKNATRDTEIPIEVVVEPPPPPPPPPEQKKQEQPKPEKQKYTAIEKPAYDAPRTPNNETIKRQITDNQTRAPTQAPPAPANETKPTPDQPPKPAQNAAPEPAQQTAAPETTKDEADAEPMDKAAPIKAPKAEQKMKPAKQRAALPDDQRAAVARQLASLTPSPNFSIAAESKVAPVTGGTEDMRYLAVLFGMIMRQQHVPAQPVRHSDVRVVVGFWLNDRGALVQQALYHTSGYPEIDEEAMAAVRRAAPFPEPPPNEPHGFTATMVFPPK